MRFESGTGPRVFAQPLGSDLPKAVVDGVRKRMAGCPAEEMARVTLIVNTSRMRRRIRTLFSEGPASFVPRILLLTEIENLLPEPLEAESRPALQRRLQLAELLAPVIRDRPEFAPKSSIFALADSLASLLDEMQGEGVSSEAIAALDVTDESNHWKFAQSLITVAQSYVESLDGGLDPEARQRLAAAELVTHWNTAPPEHPILLVGSTGSRGTTFALMEAIAKLETGAVLLPGYDFDQPAAVWSQMSDALRFEDHPQFRFAKFLTSVNLAPTQIPRWSNDDTVSRDRNRVVSLALRPAPVTDAWLREGPSLPDLPSALSGLSLVEAQSQREEALAISMRMRMAVDQGQRVALISPDRMLGRQVSASLDRWGILADDSGGTPLHLSAPGRFLRHTAELFLRPLDAEMLLTLLKHPLTQSGSVFPEHGLYTQRLELVLRRDSAPFPDAARLEELVARAAKGTADHDRMVQWGEWVVSAFCANHSTQPYSLEDWLQHHLSLSRLIASGSISENGELWDEDAGIEARGAFASLQDCAQHSGQLTASDYGQLITSVMTGREVRDRHQPHPHVMIWGTLEARVQGADLVILGGLNDGIWPEAVTADPWLNRRMRHEAGLLLPDRKVGLSAHDFQQAIAAPEVWITRSVRSDDAETVPSRWLNRLMNLVSGLPGNKGPEALAQMRKRGQDWLDRAAALEAVSPTRPAQRAAPKPPLSARPRDFSVTEIKTLIRDPYAIYAKHCLNLRPIDPLVQEPDAPIRGIVIHEIMERFTKRITADPDALTVDTLMAETDTVLTTHVLWPTVQLLWRARMQRVAAWVVDSERARLARGTPFAMEKDAQGKLVLPEIGSIRARADRVDLSEDGHALLYDYKSGNPPSPKEQKFFDKQLLIEAAMVEEGAFQSLGVRPVEDAVYIGLSANPVEVPAPLSEETPAETLDQLNTLLSTYLAEDQYYLSRRTPRNERDQGDYDHLARYGEWDDVDDPAPEDLS